MSLVRRDESELDPETWVAAQILKAQAPSVGAPALPGMTPGPVAARMTGLIRSGSRLRIHSHLIGNGPTCPRCRCGRKETS